MVKRSGKGMKPKNLQDYRAARPAAPLDGDDAGDSLEAAEDRLLSFEASKAVARARKVEALHDAVEAGVYQSDASLTAESMMEHDRR